MKKVEAQILHTVIKNIIKDNRVKINGGSLYALIKNKKLLQNQIKTYEQMFSFQQIQGYKQFQSDKNTLMQNYIKQNKIQNGISQQQSIKHNNILNSKIVQLYNNENHKLYRQKSTELGNSKFNFLNTQYQQVDKLSKINLDDISDIKLSGEQMQVLMTIIVQE